MIFLNRIHIKKIFLTIVTAFAFWVNTGQTKVDPPNYDFSLDAFELFSNKSTQQRIEQRYGKGELISEKKGLVVKKYYVAHLRYKFPVYVQMYEGVPVDFYAKLPSYFIHDIFHQSIITRYGKQDSYYKQEEQAVYVWKNEKSMKFIYNGACTITCFPIYYVGISLAPPKGAKGHTPIFKTMVSAATFK